MNMYGRIFYYGMGFYISQDKEAGLDVASVILFF